jgi:NADH-quinone oxidoreductase subunit C
MTEPPDQPDGVNPSDQPDGIRSPDQPDGVNSSDPSDQLEAADPLELRQADEAALAVGFSLATGAEVEVSRDGAGTPVVDVPASTWVAAAQHARDTLDLDFLDWLSAVDQMDSTADAGLDVVLHVAATTSAGIEGDRARYQRRDFGPPRVRRLMLRTRVPAGALVLPSLTALWPGVAWHERETFEMFGLDFTDFDDGSGLALRPLLLPDGFEGTPLRKSFVLAARAAKAWPGGKDPADSGGKAPSRRKIQPPGVPDPSWGPREPGASVPEPAPARERRPRTPRTGPAAGPRAGATPRTGPAPNPATDPATDPAAERGTGPATAPATDPATSPGADPGTSPAHGAGPGTSPAHGAGPGTSGTDDS